MRKAPFAARRGPSTAEAFKRVGYEVNGLFSFTSFAGESAPRRSSTSSAPLAGLRRGRAVPGRWALDSTRSAVDAVSMHARHGPPTHELGAQHDAISQARAACFDSTVGLDARTPAKCQELLVAAEKASQSALSSLSRAATFPSLPNAAIATYC